MINQLSGNRCLLPQSNTLQNEIRARANPCLIFRRFAKCFVANTVFCSTKSIKYLLLSVSVYEGYI